MHFDLNIKTFLFWASSKKTSPLITELSSLLGNDSGFYTSNTSNTSMSGYADISVERQKATCLGTVQATYDYSGSDEEGMLSLKASNFRNIGDGPRTRFYFFF